MDDGSDLGSYSLAEQIFNSKVQNDQLMCRIYEAYAGPSLTHHNCLGDNFNDLTNHILKFLRIVGHDPEVFEYHESFAILSHLINTTWERISDIFMILSVPDSYKFRHYPCFIRMRKWSNFFKHPKEFAWLVCFPQWHLEGSEKALELQADGAYKVIDDQFLKKYYSADRSKGLAGEFANHRDKVVVLLPDVVQVMELICDELNDFVNVVTKNPVYFEILNDKATIINFYEHEHPPTTTTVTTTTTSTPPDHVDHYS